MKFDAGSTHIPLLVGLGSILPIRKVLELGAGHFSTPTFLNCAVFHQLEMLTSYEDIPEWQDEVRDNYGESRLNLVEVIPSLKELYDLIFVDNSHHGDVRAATIKRVAEESSGVLVVLHDAQIAQYIPEIERFQKSTTVKTYTHWTALASNGMDTPLPDFTGIVERNLHLEPTDIEGWLKVFSWQGRIQL
jgi:hypothetical protein